MKKVMYKQTGNLNINESYEGIPLEWEIRKLTQENIAIKSISPEIFTERKDGAKPEYDIRTDKWDIAHDAMDKVSQSRILKMDKKDKKEEKKDGENAKENDISSNKTVSNAV